MEQARYWMRTAKRKHDFGSHVFASVQKPTYDSWEEQAFAEDAAGNLGGCIWPPRSYSCSFCGREFKSAQALGGHMNVHRRDRARLKQSPTPNIEVLPPHNHILNNPCTFLYNRNSEDSDQGVLITSPLSPIRVSSSPPSKIDCDQEKILGAPQFFSSIVRENQKSNMSSPQYWSNFVADKYFHVSSDLKNGDNKGSKTSESNGRANGEYVKADLSVSLKLLLCRTHSNISDAEEFQNCKRRRIDETSITLLPKSTTVEKCLQQSTDVIGPNAIDELDLELRLGDPPNVK
ncbi:hypothetical protein ACH5RR_005307 [Cinchona calisaya]|uniref:C2H2-type domain-containing protein n=1 Tax=Cinchona calisaya TaxID=153742 RepID=A0ABD3AL22_9GENT